jgi:hypothetical protein
MFGQMDASPITGIDAGRPLEEAVAELLRLTDGAEIARWIQFPRALLLFVLVPGDPKSGGIYVYDRTGGAWCYVDFHDQSYGGYSLADLDVLVNRCRFLRLVENPRLLWEKKWFLVPGLPPEAIACA